MNSTTDRALTYSLLSHIRSTGKLINGPVEIFVPLLKRALSKLNEKGVFGGEILEIKNEADSLYQIDFPIPVLRLILKKIADEINSESPSFQLFQDNTFKISNYAFTEFEETISTHKVEIENLNKLFIDFCESSSDNITDCSSLIEFIEKNKLTLSKYLSHTKIENGHDYTVQARFVDFFKSVPKVYDIIRKLYLGSILAGYLEYKVKHVRSNVELLFDTNFILGLLDLNTPESTHTCSKIVEITREQGFRLSVLKDTLIESNSLLKGRAYNFNSTYLQKKVYPEDIYNACDRRDLNSADLERIADNLEKSIDEYGISVIHDTTKYKNIAKYSSEYEALKQYRSSDIAALHDATAFHYVMNKRGGKVRDFEDVNCWFVNNALNRDKYGDDQKWEKLEYQPVIIKADDFLNIIWLRNPAVTKSVDPFELSDIGLSSLVSLGLSESLPKLSIIRELDDNIRKYSEDSKLTDGDIVRIATRITTKQLKDLDHLNELAKTDKEQFVERLNAEAEKQRQQDEERLKRLDSLLEYFEKKAIKLVNIRSDYENRTKSKIAEVENLNTTVSNKDAEIIELRKKLDFEKRKSQDVVETIKAEKRQTFIDQKLFRWQRKSTIELIIWVVVFCIFLTLILFLSNWNSEKATAYYDEIKSSIIFSSVVSLISMAFSGISLKKWYDRHHNYSNIENYRKQIIVPKKLL